MHVIVSLWSTLGHTLFRVIVLQTGVRFRGVQGRGSKEMKNKVFLVDLVMSRVLTAGVNYIGSKRI